MIEKANEAAGIKIEEPLNNARQALEEAVEKGMAKDAQPKDMAPALKEAAEQLAKSGARVLITGRSAEKARQVVDDINRWSVNPASYVTLDLSSPTSVRRAAQEILEQCQQINILINCAGPLYLCYVQCAGW